MAHLTRTLFALVLGCAAPVVSTSEILAEADLSELGYVVGLTQTSAGDQVALTNDGRVWLFGDGLWSERISLREGPVSDIVRLEGQRYAVTMPNEGYLLDLADDSFRRHFCYLPEPEVREEEPPVVDQPTMELSRSVTYNRDDRLLIAQPQTLPESGDGDGFFSEVAGFDPVSGTELNFINMGEPNFSAGALIAVSTGTLLFGQGSELSVFDMFSATRSVIRDLRSVGIFQIEAMMFDQTTGRVWIVDGPSGRAIALDLQRTLTSN